MTTNPQLSGPAAGLAALLLASAPLLLAPSSAAADDRTKAQIEHEETLTTPNKAQIEHRETVRDQVSTSNTKVDAPARPSPVSGNDGAAVWQLALSAALGAALVGGGVIGARQMTQHRHALPA